MDMSDRPSPFVTESRSGELSQISDQVSRLVESLAHIAQDSEVARRLKSKRPQRDCGETGELISVIRETIYARRMRDRFFDADLFADPAWDMLLDLFEAEIAQQRVSVSSLTIAAAVPASTALRWITSMTRAELFRRRPDPTDARRVFIELSPKASAAMRGYFDELRKLQAVG